jgi:hypothetical protein
VRLAFIFAAFALACTRVPPEWRDASQAANVHQSDCVGTLADLDQGRRERIEVRGETGALHVDYLDAHFRCEQRVTAYVKVAGVKVDVLVQPIEMHPASVAKCDCLYNIAIDVPRLAAGVYEVTLQRRSDDRQTPNDPATIGRASATVK